MAKLTPTVIASSGSGTSVNSDIALKIQQAIGGSGDVDLLQTTGDTPNYAGSSDGAVLIGDATNFPASSTGTPREKVDVEGAVRAFEFIDQDGREISFLLNKLLPTAELLNVVSADNGVNVKIGFDTGETDSSLYLQGIGSTFNVQSDNQNPTKQGALDSGFSTVGGDLNFNIPSTSNYPADSFGRAREGYLALEIDTGSGYNEISNTRADLDAGSIGSDSINTTASGTNSGFNLSASQNVTFADGSDFDGDQYRTGTWQFDETDLGITEGFFSLRVSHYDDTDALIARSNDVQYVYDPANTITFSNVRFTNPNTSGVKRLSGISFNTQAFANFEADVSGVYQYTYDGSENAISFPDQSNCEISSRNIPDPSSFSDVLGVSQQARAGTETSIQYLIGEGFESRVRVSDPIEGNATSGLAGPTFEFLVDGVDTFNKSNDSDTYHDFEFETRRILNDVSDWNSVTVPSVESGGANHWDSTETIGSEASAGYDDGLQVIESKLVYPSINFTSIANGPSNPDRDYNGLTGTRRYIGYFTNPNASSSFAISVNGSGTMVSTGPSGGVNINNPNEFHLEVRVGDINTGGGTGWLDVTKPFIQGTPQETLDDGDGAYASGIAKNDNFSTDGTPIGITTGTVSTSNHNDLLIFRVTYGTGSTVELDDISVVWNA